MGTRGWATRPISWLQNCQTNCSNRARERTYGAAGATSASRRSSVQPDFAFSDRSRRVRRRRKAAVGARARRPGPASRARSSAKRCRGYAPAGSSYRARARAAISRSRRRQVRRRSRASCRSTVSPRSGSALNFGPELRARRPFSRRKITRRTRSKRSAKPCSGWRRRRPTASSA